MNQKERRILKQTGVIGVTTTIAFTIIMCLSVYFSPWFNLNKNWISELGGSFGLNPVWSSLGIGSIIFNSGLILTAIFGMLFSILLFKSKIFDTKLGKFGIFSLFIEMIAIFCVGLFPVTLGKIHSLFSSIMFGIIPIILLALGYELVKIYGKKWILFTNILFITSLFSFIIFQFGGSKAIAELIALYSLFLFLTIFCINLIDNFYVKSVNTLHRNKYYKPTVKIRSILSSIWFKT